VKSEFISTTAIYTFANVINAALPLFLMPLLTKHLDPESYGLIVMFQLLCNLLGSFMGVSIHGAVGRQYVLLEKSKLAIYVANCIFILIMSTAVAAIFFVAFAQTVERFSHFPSGWHWAVIVGSFFQFITLVLLSIWQMEGRAFAYAAIQIAQTIINIGLTAYFVVALELDWYGSVIAQVLAFTITGFTAAWVLQKQGWLNWRYDFECIKDALRFGVPLIPHTIGATLISMTDRVMITNLVGLTEAGIYTVGYQIALSIAMLQNSFNQAWVPWAYKKLKSDLNTNKKILVRVTYTYFVVILLLVFVLETITPSVLEYLVGKQFQNASVYVFWIAMGYAFNGMYKMVTVYIFYHSKTHLLALITAVTAMINIGLTYIAVHYNGAIGVAQATAFSFLLSFIFTWYLSTKVQPMPWGIIRRDT